MLVKGGPSNKFWANKIWWKCTVLSSANCRALCLGLNESNTIHVGVECSIVNTLRPRQDGRYFADDILKCIFLNENVWISLKIPLKFVPKGPINNSPAQVQIMAWRRPGDKPLSEPMMDKIPTHICVTRPQWVKLFACKAVIKTDSRIFQSGKADSKCYTQP